MNLCKITRTAGCVFTRHYKFSEFYICHKFMYSTETNFMKHTIVSLNNKNIHDTIKTYIMLTLLLIFTGTYTKYSALCGIWSFLRFLNNCLHKVNTTISSLIICISALHLPIPSSPVQKDVPIRLQKSPMSITVRYDRHTQFGAQLFHHHVQPQGQIKKHWVSQKLHYRHNTLLN